MCRSIRTLYNFVPPATGDEIRAASLQFVRKVSGFTKPSKVNEASFALAVDRVASAAQALLDSLVTSAAPRDRDVEASRLRAKSLARFGPGARGESTGTRRRARPAVRASARTRPSPQR